MRRGIITLKSHGSPSEGNLLQLYQVFAYLKSHHNSEIVFDPSEPEIGRSLFVRQDWAATVYGDSLEEELPVIVPEGRGQGFIINAYVDSVLAGDVATMRSRTGFLVFLNSALIFWMSKKQTGIETSSFSSEFTAMKQCSEYARGLRYKLKMMRIACIEPTYIFGDNQSVLASTTVPHSVLKKKSNAIAYHFVREGCARDEWRTAYVKTMLNPVDLLTKSIPHNVNTIWRKAEAFRKHVAVSQILKLLYHAYLTEIEVE